MICKLLYYNIYFNRIEYTLIYFLFKLGMSQTIVL